MIPYPYTAGSGIAARKHRRDKANKRRQPMNQNLPQDPIILLSYVNTQLRDHYATLAEFCAAMDADQAELEKKLRDVDYEYDPEQNAFV